MTLTSVSTQVALYAGASGGEASTISTLIEPTAKTSGFNQVTRVIRQFGVIELVNPSMNQATTVSFSTAHHHSGV